MIERHNSYGMDIIFDSFFFRWAGLFLFCVGIILNPWIIGRLLTDDGQIGSEKVRVFLSVLNFLFCFLGFGFFIRPPFLRVRRQVFFSFLMIVMAVFVCLGILEIFARVYLQRQHLTYIGIGDKVYPLSGLAGPQHYTYDPITGYSLIPNIHDTKQQITTDENGFRITGKSVDLNKESIIFVGDSTVFGWGTEDTGTFPYLIAQNPIFEHYNIINMGVPSYSVGHRTQVLKYKVPHFHPKVVLVSILWPWKLFGSYSSPEAWKNVDYDFYHQTIPLRTQFQPPHRLREILASGIFLMLRDAWYKIKFKSQIQHNLTRPSPKDFSMTREDEERLAEDHVRLLKEAAEPLRQRGVKVIFYIHPYQYTLFKKEYSSMGYWGREIMVRDLSALYPGDFLKEKFQGDVFFIDGCHLTPAGQEVFAEYFTGILKNTLHLN